MKVLLFVQDQYDRQPKCVGSVHGDVAARATPRDHNAACPGWMFTWDQSVHMGRADCWWLVECENAEAGRYCIAGGREPYKCHRADGPLSCRILASGGKP